MVAAFPLPRRVTERLSWVMLLVVLQCLNAAHAEVSTQVPSLARESAVKAAYLSKFAGFVEWPAGAQRRSDEPLVIGIVGNDAVATDLGEIIRSKATGAQAVTMRRLRDGEDALGLHVLFIGATSAMRVRDQSAAARGAVLIVTEQEDGLQLGAMLNFSVDGGRVRFSASVPAASARGLRLSARLLAVALSVDSGER